MRALVTGAAGFIGFHLARRLLSDGHRVVGLDSLDPYYDVDLKLGRLGQLGIGREGLDTGQPVASTEHPGFQFVKADLADAAALNRLFERSGFEVVFNLAAQAGVRHSLENPHKYVQSNVAGFLNLLEACRAHRPGHLVFASSSSVYGLNRRVPFTTRDNVDHPISMYAVTKKGNELMAHCYSHLYGLPCTGLRFFTVYGPWGRPDMALFKFTRAILAGEPIEVYNEGRMVRDFTYVDDVVEGVVRISDRPPAPDPGWDNANPSPDSSSAPFRLYNIGNNRPVDLMAFLRALEEELGRKAVVRYLPMQPGDVAETMADVGALEADTGFRPNTSIQQGIREFVRWYRGYYRIPD